MKDYAIKVSFIPGLNVVKYTMSTAVYNIWRRGVGKLVAELSNSVAYDDDDEITVSISASWFDICQNLTQPQPYRRARPS